MRTRRVVEAAMLAVMSGVCAACRTGEPAGPDLGPPSEMPVPPLAPFGVSAAWRDAPEIAFYIDRSGTQELVVRRVSEPGGTWRVQSAVRSPGGVEERVVRTESFVSTSTGGVALLRVESPADNALTEFEPPLIVAPPSVGAEDWSFQQDVAMVVRSLRNPSVVTHRGRAVQSTWREPEMPMAVPAGEFTVTPVRTRFQATLGPTLVTTETSQWFAPGSGPIGEDRTETATLLGVQVRRVNESWRLTSTAPPR